METNVLKPDGNAAAANIPEKGTERKLRDSNLELYRIITMLLIVAHHYMISSGLWNAIFADPMSPRSLFLLVFGAWGKTGINCFMLIGG